MKNKRDFIKGLSKEELLEVLTRSKAGKSDAIKKLDRSAPFFKQSYAQSRQWFMDQFATGGIYNVVQSYLLKGNLKLGLLKKAILYLIERHESLRTVFNTVDYEPVQLIKAYEEFEIDYLDFSTLPENIKRQKVDELNKTIAKRPFDLTTGPLYRFTIVKLSNLEHVISISLHHIISDGWSFGVILKEIVSSYTAMLDGTFEKRILPIQYVEYSEWQREQVEGGKLDNQLEFWTNRLKKDHPPIQLLYDFKREASQTFSGKTEYFEFNEEIVREINNYCNDVQGSMYHFMLTALFITMYSYSLDQEIYIGTPVANRTKVELEQLIGLFINTVVINGKIKQDESWTKLFQKVKANCEQAFNHSELPFDKVVENLNVKRDTQYSPIFQILYVQTEESMLQVDVPGITVEVIPTSADTAQFDLSLYTTIMKDAIVGGFEYNVALFRKQTILQLIEDFTTVVEAMLSNSEIKILEIMNKLKKKKIVCAVVSSFIAEPVMPVIDYWKNRFMLPCKFELAPYSQVFQQLADENSLLAKADMGIIIFRVEDWVQGKEIEDCELANLLTENIALFKEYLDKYLADGNNALLYICPMSDQIRNGAIGTKVEKIEDTIIATYERNENVLIINGSDVPDKYDLETFNDSFGDKEGHVPYIREYFTAMGTEIAVQIVKKSIKGNY